MQTKTAPVAPFTAVKTENDDYIWITVRDAAGIEFTATFFEEYIEEAGEYRLNAEPATVPFAMETVPAEIDAFARPVAERLVTESNAFRREQERLRAETAGKEQARFDARCAELGLTPAVLKIIEGLEREVARLKSRLGSVEHDVERTGEMTSRHYDELDRRASRLSREIDEVRFA